MNDHITLVKVIAVITALVGVQLIIIGALSGPSAIVIVIGAAFLIAAYIAYKSGTSHIRKLEEKKKKGK